MYYQISGLTEDEFFPLLKAAGRKKYYEFQGSFFVLVPKYSKFLKTLPPKARLTPLKSRFWRREQTKRLS